MKTKMISLLIAMLVMVSCQKGERPPLEKTRTAILKHFELPVYAGMVEVLDMEYVDGLHQAYQESEFFDLVMRVSIRVHESYKVSRIFAHGAFDIDHTWPDIMRERLESAPDDEARQRIIELYESRTFTAGEHMINAVVTMVRPENQWIFLSLFMEPLDEMVDVLPKQMQEDDPSL